MGSYSCKKGENQKKVYIFFNKHQAKKIEKPQQREEDRRGSDWLKKK